MSDTIAPSIDAQALPSTPAKEWANETQSAVTSAPTESTTTTGVSVAPNEPSHPLIPRFVSSQSTPGPEVPGAYPRDNHTTTSAGTGTGTTDLKGAALGLVDGAKHYIPDQATIAHAGTTAKNYISSYFPSVAAKTADTNVPKPITTTTNTTTHLPPSQYPVAAPDSESTSATASNATTTTSNLSTTAQKGSDPNLTSPTPDGNRTPPAIDAVAGNTREGLGILPGAKSESGVAILPDERNNNTDPSYNNQRAGSGGVGDLPGSRSETNVAVLPEERAQNEIESQPKNTSQSTSRTDAPSNPNPNSNSNPHSNSSSSNTSSKPSSAATSISPDHPEPTPLNTNARTHPLAGGTATFHGVPLEEPYQKALDGDEERQLNIMVPKADINDANEPSLLLQAGGLQKPANDWENQDPFINKHDMTGTQKVKERLVNVVPGHRDDSNVTVTRSPVTTHAESNTFSTMADTGHNTGKVAGDDPRPTSKLHDHERVSSTGSGGSWGRKSIDGASKTSSTRSPTSPHTHTSLLNKIRGEAKVISGKIGKNEEKVEEGRRMMHSGK